jgi:hypothetical protein
MNHRCFKITTGIKKIVGRLALLSLLLTTGCGIEASITNLVSTVDDIAKDLHRTEPDITYGETVTTSNGTPGYVIKAAFGETGDQQTLSNGWQVEGFLYE